MARSEAFNDWIREALTNKDPSMWTKQDARHARYLWRSTKSLEDRLLMVKIRQHADMNEETSAIKAEAMAIEENGQ